MRTSECFAPRATCTARGSLHLCGPQAACKAFFRGAFCCSRFTCKHCTLLVLLHHCYPSLKATSGMYILAVVQRQSPSATLGRRRTQKFLRVSGDLLALRPAQTSGC